jgi:hypothetical protein
VKKQYSTYYWHSILTNLRIVWACLWSIAINEVYISFQVSISIRVIVDTVEFLNAFTPVQLFDTVEHDNPVLHGVLFGSSMHLYCQELTPVSEGDCQHSLIMWNTFAFCTYTLSKGNIYQHVAQATNHVYSDTFISHSHICCFLQVKFISCGLNKSPT